MGPPRLQASPDLETPVEPFDMLKVYERVNMIPDLLVGS